MVGVYSALSQEKDFVYLPKYEIHSPDDGNNIRNEVLETNVSRSHTQTTTTLHLKMNVMSDQNH